MGDVLSRVLGLARNRFAPTKELAGSDDFFDALGIDSVQALDLLSELEREFGVELPDYELAEVRTFADLAERVSDRL